MAKKPTNQETTPAANVATEEQPLPVVRQPFTRDENGLINGLSYKFTPIGHVDWKSMIPTEFVVVNEDYYKDKTVPTDINSIPDNHKLILLGGIKELASIRGLISRENKVIVSTEDICLVECRVTFIGNYETSGKELVYSEIASADVNKNCTSDISKNYKETIAANRAFGRAVRGALNINIVSKDEIDNVRTRSFSGGNRQSSAPSVPPTSGESSVASNETEGQSTLPWAMLQKRAEGKGVESFADFKARLQSRIEAGRAPGFTVETIANWNDYKDISAPECFRLNAMLEASRKV